MQKPLPLGPGARTNARVVFALVLVGLALWTASSFLPPLMWATILAVALWPLYVKFAARFNGPSATAALVFTVLVALVLVTPISLAVYTIAEQSDMLLDWLKRAREGGIEVPDWSPACLSPQKAHNSGGAQI
jgi:predicted PurR-regulated permease PerM